MLSTSTFYFYENVFFKKIILNYMCVYMPTEAARGARRPEAGVKGDAESPIMGAAHELESSARAV